MHKEKILITGAAGQLGAVLTSALAGKYSNEQIVVSDIKPFNTDFKFHQLDVKKE